MSRNIPSGTTDAIARSLLGGASPPGVRDACDVDVVHLDRVQEARAALTTDDRLVRLAAVLGLLSNVTRLKILLALQPNASGPRRELCVCDLAVVAGASKSMTSHQLRLLRTAGFVVQRRAGKLAFYRLAEGLATELLGSALVQVFPRSPLPTQVTPQEEQEA